MYIDIINDHEKHNKEMLAKIEALTKQNQQLQKQTNIAISKFEIIPEDIGESTLNSSDNFGFEKCSDIEFYSEDGVNYGKPFADENTEITVGRVIDWCKNSPTMELESISRNKKLESLIDKSQNSELIINEVFFENQVKFFEKHKLTVKELLKGANFNSEEMKQELSETVLTKKALVGPFNFKDDPIFGTMTVWTQISNKDEPCSVGWFFAYNMKELIIGIKPSPTSKSIQKLFQMKIQPDKTTGGGFSRINNYNQKTRVQKSFNFKNPCHLYLRVDQTQESEDKQTDKGQANMNILANSMSKIWNKCNQLDGSLLKNGLKKFTNY